MLVVAALFAVDLVTSEDVILVTLFVAGPLLAAVRGGPRGTLAIAVLAIVLAVIALIDHGTSGGQDAVRIATVLLGSCLAVLIAALRTRLSAALARLDALYERTPVGIGLLDTQLNFVHVNGRLAEFLPYARSVQADLERVRDTEEPMSEVPVTGGEREWLASFWPVRRPGEDEPFGIGIMVVEVTDRRRAERERERALARTALLAEASELFDQSLEEEPTLERVARLCVRDLADTCVILVGDSPLRVRRVAAVARDPGREPAVLDAQPMHDVLRSSRGVVTTAPEGLGTPWAVIVPLRARGSVHGVLAAGFDALDEAEGDELLALFEDLGRRAALALDSARLYEERDHVARTLQRSLLPPELPDIPGVELAARYVAAGAGNEVGGDFYDCFATGGGDWAAVIGDVCGKGAEAAAVTALARYTLRASVLHTRHPRAVLGGLNEALLRQRLDYRFCTVLYVALTPRTRTVTATIATGGHPLPLVLRAGGTVETAGSPGTLLGIVPDPEVGEETIELEPGDALVLYTDGAVEATPDHRASGPDRLAGLLATCAGAGAARIAEAVERDTLEALGGLARDDVAVFVVRVLGDAPAPFDPIGEGVAAPT